MRSTLKCDIMFHIIVGDFFMKTKIIYISGSETFEMTQIRAAFEEVRAALDLDKDTILFGVPVDCDSAIEEVKTKEEIVSNEIPEVIPIASENSDVSLEIPIEETVDDIEPVMVAETENETKQDVVEEETIVPILSVLAINDEESVSEPSVAEDVVSEPVEDIVSETEDIIEITDTVVDGIEPVATEIEVEDAVEIVEISDTEIPENPMEKTLEELLESMTPLREDVVHQETDDEAPVDDVVDVLPPDDTDATLAQLATEFVQNEGNIPSTPKTETSGKIGKLKNILPFKKAKRDDSGIMGDLFGWAGVAANDEDFSIPGFFTQAASKK